MPKLESVPQDTPVDRVMEIMRRDGAVILTGMMSRAQVDAMTAELTPLLETTEPGRESFSGFKTTRTGALPARSAKVRGAILDPRVRAVCDAVLLPNAEGYQVNVTHIIRILPGEVAQVMH
ncbi:MAG: phytanoyl-CoA dioxygenase family protein, partial [Gemmatimonadales bacterium]